MYGPRANRIHHGSVTGRNGLGPASRKLRVSTVVANQRLSHKSIVATSQGLLAIDHLCQAEGRLPAAVLPSGPMD